MNKDEANRQLVSLWADKAEEALASAGLELASEHLSFAVNRLYYACFYVVTALLLQDGKRYSKHSAVKSEFGRSYVKTGRVDADWYRMYQELFDARQQGDYIPTVVFDKSVVESQLQRTKQFVDVIKLIMQER